MNKADLIERLSAGMTARLNREVSKKDAEAFLASLEAVTTFALSNKDEVTLPGLGKLSVVDKPERQGRNPKTGEALTIAATRAPKFSAAKALKDALNG